MVDLLKKDSFFGRTLRWFDNWTRTAFNPDPTLRH